MSFRVLNFSQSIHFFYYSTASDIETHPTWSRRVTLLGAHILHLGLLHHFTRRFTLLEKKI
jgi:hypothetical protein